MNIIIPLGGHGERFKNAGYNEPKPLIKIFDKIMLQYVFDNIYVNEDDKIFIIFNKNLNKYNFSNIITKLYPKIVLVELTNDTSGAAETLYLGIKYIINNYSHNNKCLILDCDTFYTEDIVNNFRNSNNNMVFYTKNYDKNPIYSYITLDEKSYIITIQEKNKISDNANTGAYAFMDINILLTYCQYIVENNITFNNEPYTSCVIYEMIKNDIQFIGKELDCTTVFSLGTPKELEKYKNNTYAFLMDLDGTLVKTDDIYFNVWYNILEKYNIELTPEIFKKYIQGNNDTYILNTLISNVNINSFELSKKKDQGFIENIHKLNIIEGTCKILETIKKLGHKCCIVTNCNKIVAEEIVKYTKIDKYIDFIISNDDCSNGKPNSEPYHNAIKKYNISNEKCIIFEDSKTGILSGIGVNPKLLIGVKTIYTHDELMNSGVNLTIDNYVDFNVKNLLEFNLDISFNIKKFIINSTHLPIDKITIDEKKLKGGYIADVISISIKTNNNEIHDYVLKYENQCKTTLSIMANQLQLYEREYYFYEYISKYINVKIPKFISLVKDNNQKNIGLLLENLSIGDRFKINLNLNIENIDVSMAIINNMAKMHSQFWNKNLSERFPELKKNNNETFCPFFKKFICEKLQIFKSKWGNILTQQNLNTCDDIFNKFEFIQERLSINNLTLIHGDIKSPNIFYDTKNDNEPYFLDWQHCANGKGVQDLIFFIIESFDLSNIKLLFPIFKNYYYKKILEYNVQKYSFFDFEQDLIDAICYIPFFTAIWFGSTPNDDLIDKNWPYFFIQKFIYLLELMNYNSLDK